MKNIFFLLLISFVTIQAGGLKITETDKQILHALYNSHCSTADSLIELKLKESPDDPKYLFLKAHYWFYARFLDNQNYSRDSVLTLIEKYSEKAIEAGNKIEPTVENRFYLGSSYGFLSRVYGMRHEYWNAFWAAKDCRNYLESVLEDDPEFYDAYMGLGVIEYYAGTRVDGFLGAIAWLVGMSGDKNLGLEYFQKVYDNGSLLKPEAEFALTILYRFLERNVERSIPMMNSFLAEYPDNRMINIFQKRTRMYEIVRDGNIGELIAEKDSLASKYLVTNTYVLTSLAETLKDNNLANEALQILHLNEGLYPNNTRTFTSLGDAYLNNGNKPEAKRYFTTALQVLTDDALGSPEYKEQVREEIQDKLATL